MMANRYKYYQPNINDIKDEFGDCVIRAICKATGMDWLDVFDGLVRHARVAQCIPNQPKAFTPYLEELGFKYHPIKRGSKITVSDFAGMNADTAICNVRCGYGSHFVTVSDGKYHDTWDSGSKYLFGYWSKEGED